MLDEYQEQQKQKFQQHAELVRLQTCTLVNLQIKKEDQLKPTELWPFEWDPKPKSETDDDLTDEQILQRNIELASMLD